MKDVYSAETGGKAGRHDREHRAERTDRQTGRQAGNTG